MLHHFQSVRVNQVVYLLQHPNRLKILSLHQQVAQIQLMRR